MAVSLSFTVFMVAFPIFKKIFILAYLKWSIHLLYCKICLYQWDFFFLYEFLLLIIFCFPLEKDP